MENSQKDPFVPSQPIPSSAPEKTSPWFLLAMPIGLGFLLGIIVIGVRLVQEVDMKSIYLGLDGMRLPLACGLVLTITSIVLLFVFRPKLKTIAITTACLIIVGFTLSKTVRIESFYGNMIPRLAWRWKPTAEEQVKSYLVSTTSKPTSTSNASLFQSTESDFPQFLGKNRDAIVADKNFVTDWSQNPPQQLWRHPVGLGWSSFAIVGQAAIDLEQRGDLECVVCYNALTGEELWSWGDTVRFEDEHGDGPRSTPTIVGERVLSIGANGLLSCLDLTTGSLIWKTETLDNPESNLHWGMSGSPLVYGHNVIVTPGGGESGAVKIYSLADGKLTAAAGSDQAGYASPIVSEICGERQILSFNGAGLRGFSLAGEPLWLSPWLTQGESQRVNVAQPIVLPTSTAQTTQVLISSGYDNGTALIEVTCKAGVWQAEQRWISKHLKAKMSNFVLYQGYIYGLDNGILTCLDAATGERQWKRGRYGHGQMLLVGDKLLIQAENGEVVMVSAVPTAHQELTRFAALSDKTWNNLALAGDLLIVRNDREAAAYRLPTQTSVVH